jgi:transcriptional regulator with XRE-family HTH domain
MIGPYIRNLQVDDMTPSKLRDALHELKWSQKAFADKIGMDADTVSRWSTGKTPVPPLVAEYLRLARKVRSFAVDALKE